MGLRVWPQYWAVKITKIDSKILETANSWTELPITSIGNLAPLFAVMVQKGGVEYIPSRQLLDFESVLQLESDNIVLFRHHDHEKSPILSLWMCVEFIKTMC